jgi:hypothetical protein
MSHPFITSEQFAAARRRAEGNAHEVLVVNMGRSPGEPARPLSWQPYKSVNAAGVLVRRRHSRPSSRRPWEDAMSNLSAALRGSYL